jgi:hypothetical protein
LQKELNMLDSKLRKAVAGADSAIEKLPGGEPENGSMKPVLATKNKLFEKPRIYPGSITCYLHPDRPGIRSYRLPCAPGGCIWVCAKCIDDPKIVDKVWAKYKKQYHRRIALFKTPGNPKN